MFSRPQKALRTRRRDDRRYQQTFQDGRQVETTVETILDFGKIAMSVFGKIEGMVGSRVGSLQIAEESIDRTELLQLGTAGAAAGHGTRVRRPRGGDRPKAPQAVRH